MATPRSEVLIDPALFVMDLLAPGATTLQHEATVTEDKGRLEETSRIGAEVTARVRDTEGALALRASELTRAAVTRLLDSPADAVEWWVTFGSHATRIGISLCDCEKERGWVQPDAIDGRIWTAFVAFVEGLRREDAKLGINKVGSSVRTMLCYGGYWTERTGNSARFLDLVGAVPVKLDATHIPYSPRTVGDQATRSSTTRPADPSRAESKGERAPYALGDHRHVERRDLPPADWYPDPSRRHEFRYWDGERWTEHVADGGVTRTDQLPQ